MYDLLTQVDNIINSHQLFLTILNNKLNVLNKCTEEELISNLFLTTRILDIQEQIKEHEKQLEIHQNFRKTILVRRKVVNKVIGLK